MTQVSTKPATATAEPPILNQPPEQDASEILNHDVAQNSSGKNLFLTLRNLPKELREQLKSCPAEGNGVHPWLFRTAMRLHEWFTEDEIVETLKAHLSCRRPEREILEAVTNSGRVVRGEMAQHRNQWPSVDYEMVNKIVVDSSIRLEDLRAVSPEDLGTGGPVTEDILDVLFPGNPLLCVGRKANVFRTGAREYWRGRASNFQFIVPSPMTKKRGLKKDGKESQRCLDNTGPRKFVVIEFDITNEGEWARYLTEWQRRGITVDDVNAALLVALGTTGLPRLPLVLAVHSGGKSVHGWYPCQGLSEKKIKPFMYRAVRLGADKATWTKCQFVRMPDGMRDDGKRQRVQYFAPGVIQVQGGAI
jgi:hypothetical protein